MLPDDVLIEIFDLYREEDEDENENEDDYPYVWGWNILVRVCRRWRQVVFASPLRLDLKILCKSGTPVRKNLGIWPALPIVIKYIDRRITNGDEDNIVTALEHVDRVCKVWLGGRDSELERISTAMRKSFPVLTDLRIWCDDAPVLPAEFLGGSAPRLQEINLNGISFPALLTLLLSTSDLVSLELYNIPPYGYISPEAMVVGLAALPSLHFFFFGFQSATPRPDLIHPPPVTRTLLPALTDFYFKGASEYLEVLSSRIDAPHLGRIRIHYLNQLVDFQVSQLSRFIDRSLGPKLAPSKYARITFHSRWVTFYMSHENSPYQGQLSTILNCQGIDSQVSHIAQVLSQFSTTLSHSAAVHLKIEVSTQWVCPTEGMDDVDWRHLLLQFSTTQTLHVSRELAENVALALEHMVAGAFPSLDLIFLEGQPASSVEKFLASCRSSGRLVTVVDPGTEFDERVESFYINE